ncbi:MULTISPECIES: sialic acid TRAP transporter substrate-binding protein SiaP [Chelativorans]|jgi:C4-dicarboxylate-binding protein DctP|uniref:TRAP dicarboxylate transporter, DctP subunit n=1 Tax=Chelativorans sp. (strain BNC1) TaxID=266779 RepID=Q11FC2_CHESB|nr:MULTISPECIES: sialic acid TRAP transporter substrate-binding protein SiaP [Chelativorans]
MRLFTITACGILAALTMTGSALADEVSIRLGHVGAPVSPQQTIAELFASKVEEYSDGSVTVQIFNSGTLGNERQLQEGVRSSTLDMTIAGTFSYFVPWAGALEAPMLYSSLEHFTNFFSSEDGAKLMEAFQADADVKALFVVPHGGFRYITMRDIEVKSPADLKGVKIRNPNVPSFNVMAEAVGAIPTPIDFSELYVALQRDVVQGQHNPVGNIVGAKLYEVQDSLSMVPWGISPHLVSMSTRAWERLDDAQKEAVVRASAETAKEYPAIAVAEEEELLSGIEEQITIIRPDEIDLEAFLATFRDTGLPALKNEYGDAAGKWLDAIDAAR